MLAAAGAAALQEFTHVASKRPMLYWLATPTSAISWSGRASVKGTK